MLTVHVYRSVQGAVQAAMQHMRQACRLNIKRSGCAHENNRAMYMCSISLTPRSLCAQVCVLCQVAC